MLTAIFVCLTLIIVFYILNKNKKASPDLLLKKPTVYIDFTAKGTPDNVFKAILLFSQSSDYKIDYIKEDAFEVILNYSPKMGEQTNGTFFPIWVTAAESTTTNVCVGAKDKSIAMKFESTRALDKLLPNLKAAILANSIN